MECLYSPFVATGKFEYQLTPNEEIESIFLVPIDYLMKSQNIVWEDLSRDGKELMFPVGVIIIIKFGD